jgi:tRNA (mo5U34)-methyltransferase
MQERLMNWFPENPGRWGFSISDIEHLKKITLDKVKFLTEKDVKGRELYSHVQKLTGINTAASDFTSDYVSIGCSEDTAAAGIDEVRKTLLAMWPWRKGPFRIFGIDIETEWRSDFKWNRVISHLKPLGGRHILDIGSSNGYYIFRMLPHNPAMVMGIEPYTNFYMQFMLLNSLARRDNIFTLPLRFEEITGLTKKFNTVFCMGILYHRRSPIDFLRDIYSMMTADGELVLETLIVEGEEHISLVPEERYAKMPNVYFIPTVPVLISWLKKAGFRNSRCVDITKTDFNEQRKTEWVNTESLEDFLDAMDQTKTIEGYPAPVRAVIIAEK